MFSWAGESWNAQRRRLRRLSAGKFQFLTNLPTNLPPVQDDKPCFFYLILMCYSFSARLKKPGFKILNFGQ
jgi:hypothetical protein